MLDSIKWKELENLSRAQERILSDLICSLACDSLHAPSFTIQQTTNNVVINYNGQDWIIDLSPYNNIYTHPEYPPISLAGGTLSFVSSIESDETGHLIAAESTEIDLYDIISEDLDITGGELSVLSGVEISLKDILDSNTGTFVKINKNAKGLITGSTPVIWNDLAALGAIKLTSLSSTATGISYDNLTGVFSLTSNYTIPTNTAIQTWNTAASWGNHALQGYATTTWVNSNFVNLTGTYSNPIWLTSLAWSKLTGIPSATTAISGILSSSDWNVFNNKQALLESGTNIKTINSSSILGTGDLLVGGVSIKNNAGTLQWTTTDGNKDIRFAGSGDTSISFNSTTRTVTITSIPGAGGGGAVTSFNGRGGAVVSEEGDYNLSHLGDVNITGITDLQILQYSSVSSNFINKTLDTSIVPENGNLYYTNSRARSAISVTGSLSYNSSTGVISYTTPTNLSSFTNDSSFITLLALSAGTGIAYDNLTGIITNTAPDKTVTFTNGAGIAVTGTYPNFTVSSSITQYTDGAARAAISLSVTGTSGNAAYNNTTGVLTIPGYTLAGLGGISFSSLLTSYALGSNAALTTADTLIGAFGKIQGQLNAKQNTLTPGALTKADDTNVTLTLGGTPSTALLQAASLTLGWTGQLSVARGGTGASSLTGIIVGTGTAALAGITGTTNQVLRKTTTGYEFYTLANESDPIFIASPAFGITSTNITNWNTAYSNNHVAVTLGTNTNGLSLVGQTLSLDLATSLLAGAMSKDDKIKLDSLTNYSLPTASSTILGGVKIGTNISVDVNGVISVTFPTAYTLPIATDSILGGVKLTTTTAQATTPTAVSNTASRTYSIQMNGSSQLVVNVPWTDTIYSHPVQTAISYTNTGASIVSGVTVNTLGHVTAISSRTLTLSDLGYTAYTHPSGDGNLHVPATLTSNNGKALIAGASAGSLSWGTPWTAMGYLTSFTESDPIFGAWSTTSRTAKTFYAAPNAADGVASFRLIVASDIPILNQNTTGSAAKWTIARNLAGNLVDGSANVLFANKFIVQGTTDIGLSGAQFLGALATGIVKNATNTGVLSIATVGTDYTLLNGSGYVKMTGTTPAYVTSIPIADLTASSITINGSSVSLGGSLSVTSNTTNNFVFKSGTALTPTEGTDIYTFNGNAAKSINLQAGTNVTLTNSAGIITINANDTSVAWGEVTGKPTTFTPSAHTLDSHSNVAITSISSNHLLKWDGSAWINFSPTWTSNTGTVTSVSVTTANGISGTVATPTTTPAITLSLGDITPTKVNGIVFSGSATPSLAISGTSTISGSNTGDNAINTLYSGLVSNATHTGDATGSTALYVVGIRNKVIPLLNPTGGLLKYNGTAWEFDTSAYLTSYTESDPIFLAWKNDNTLTANKVWASPSGSTGTASFRLLAAADIPNLDTAKITSGTFSDVRITSAVNWNSAYTFTNNYLTNYPDLVAIEALVGTSGFLKKTAVNTWTLDTNTYLTANQTVTLSGEVSGSGATAITVTISNAAVISKLLTNFTSTTGTVSATDTILQAIQKLDGNIALKQNTITGAALTKVDDTNITLTLGGSPTSALLTATSITVGWTGTLADSRIASASNWNTAFGWGNHSGLYSLLGHTHTLSQISDYSQAAVNYWTLSGSDVYRNTGKVLIGLSSPTGTATLQVTGDSLFTGNVELKGKLYIGNVESTTGINLIEGKYGNGTIFNMGSLRASGASYLSYALKADSTVSGGWVSSSGGALGRSAFVANGGYLSFWALGSTTVADGATISPTEIGRWNTTGLGVGTNNPSNILDISGVKARIFGSGNPHWASHHTTNNVIGKIQALISSAMVGTESNHPFEIRTNNTIRAYFDINGNVGIGTTSPGDILHLVGGNLLFNTNTSYGIKYNGGYATSVIRVGVDASYSTLKMDGNNGQAVTWTIDHNNASAFKAWSIVFGATSVFNIVNNGNVLIGGADTSFAKLQVTGAISSSTLTANTILKADSNKVIVSAVDGTDFISPTWLTNNYWIKSGSNLYYSAGNVAVGGNTTGYGLFSTQKIGTGVVPHYILNSGSATIGDGASIDFNGSTTYLGETTPSVRLSMVREGTAASGYFAISTRNSSSILNEWLRVTSTGNVGIGTTSPATKLHIVDNSPIARLTSTNNFYYTDYSVGFIDSRTNSNGSNSFSLKTGGVDRVFIYANGNVSIGSNTDSTFAKLQVTGAISSSTLTANTLLKSDDNKVITSVVQADVTGLLSDFYIKNQTSVQTANFNISGYGIIDNIKIHRNGVLNNTFIGAAGTGSGSTGTFNTVVGYNSLSASSSGAGNTVVGYSSLLTNTTGAYNSTLGTLVLATNTIGDYNVAIGYATMYNATTAGRNIAIGYNTARYLGNTASATVISGYNIAMGWSTMNGNTTNTTLNIGNYNVAIGYQALYLNESGSNNNVLGNGAGHDNKIGIHNVFLGTSSGYTSKASGYNTGVGTNTFRYYNDSETTTQGYNVAIGYRALEGSAIAANNIFTYTTAVGVSAGVALTSGSHNTFLGYSAGSSVTTGGYNILIGRNAGSGITTGIGNVLLGGHGGSQIATINNWMLFSDGNGTYRYQVSNNGRLIIKGTAGSDNGFGDLQVNGTIWTSSIAANSLVKTNADKTLVAVTSADITSLLGDSAYIKNQTSVQTSSNFNIDGNGTASYFRASELGFYGKYQSTALVQGIWSISPTFKVNSTYTDFDTQYGLVYGYNNAGSGAASALPNGSTKNPITDWGHQIGLTHNGSLKQMFSLTNGYSWQLGVAYFGTWATASYIHPTAASLLKYGLSIGQTGTNGFVNLRRASDGTEAGGIQFIDANNLQFLAWGGTGFLSFRTASTEKMRITSAGNVLINDLTGNTYKMYINSGTTSGDGLYVNGKIFSTDNIQSYSDRAKKSNIQDLILNDKLQKLQLQSYVINGHKSLGFIAQDIQPLFPELVGMENGFLTLDYNAIGSLGLGLSIENKNEIETLKERIKVLEEEIERLK